MDILMVIFAVIGLVLIAVQLYLLKRVRNNDQYAERAANVSRRVCEKLYSELRRVRGEEYAVNTIRDIVNDVVNKVSNVESTRIHRARIRRQI